MSQTNGGKDSLKMSELIVSKRFSTLYETTTNEFTFFWERSDNIVTSRRVKIEIDFFMTGI